MKKVAVLLDFFAYDPAYSLCTVARNQILMLLRAGYSPRVLVDDHFPDPKEKPEEAPYPWDSVELFRLPSIPRSNFVELPDDWQTHLDKMTDAMRKGLEGIEVVLTHDFIYQPSQLLYQWAGRRITEERGDTIHWCHTIHSATSPALINTTNEYLQNIKVRFPNSKIIFPNSFSRSRVASNFGYEERDVVFVPHAVDYCEFFGFHEMTTRIVEEKNMLGADVIMCYPLRLDDGKQPEWLVRIGAGLKALGKSVRIIYAAFHSTGPEKIQVKNKVYKLARKLGLNEDEVTFTCDFDKSLEVRCPRQMVRDFMTLSNVFCLPSRSETYSLVAQEAGLAGNLLVLNYDFGVMYSLYGADAIYAKFGANWDAMTGMDGETKITYDPSPETYGRDIAMKIVYELQHEKALAMKTKLRQTRNLDYVMKNYLEPLLYSWD